jgi:hypothetical protein
MMLFDPLYLVIMIVGFVLSAGASGWVKLRMNKWGDVQTVGRLRSQFFAPKAFRT